jgi:hypothetical protein
VVIFLGEPGAAKTTHLKTLRLLIDPQQSAGSLAATRST